MTDPANLRHTVLLLVVLAALVALGVGCGAASNSSAPTSTPATGTPGTTANPRHGPKATPGNEAFCDSYYHEVVVMTDLAGVSSAAGPDDTTHDAQLIAGVKQGYRTIGQQAPTPVAADLAVVDTYVQQASTVTELADFSAHPDVQQAYDRQRRWTITNCGFDPNDLTAR